jgi:hypothetical protein
MTQLSNHTKLSRPSARSSRVAVIVTLTVASLLGLLLLPSIPQDQHYHQFADQRAWFGIPNFWNVTSNLPFVAVGAAGLWRFHERPTTTVIFLGIFLTGFGSSFYHWDPSDNTLFWDRLPMTLCFMAILAATVEDRVDQRMGAALLWPLLTIGPPTVCMGTIFPLPRLAAAIRVVSSPSYPFNLLGDCGRALCDCQAVRVIRP